MDILSKDDINVLAYLSHSRGWWGGGGRAKKQGVTEVGMGWGGGG
jgi:hypothetical protein